MDEKTYNPPLHGQKSITILCLDDVCKKKRRGRVHPSSEMRGGLVRSLKPLNRRQRVR